MRRESDFVLETASWPAMVLEETGAIRRANRAALLVFGPLVEPPSASLSSLWAGESPVLDDFIARAQLSACPAKLRLPGDAQGDFNARIARVSREGARYLVLQLFQGAGAASPEAVNGAPPSQPAAAPIPKAAAPQPPPTEDATAPFLLEESPWPALLVDKNGLILRTNRAAVHEFGSNIEKTGAQLAALWLPENRQPAHEFIQQTHETPRPTHLRLKIGVSCVFYAHSCPSGENVLIQFLRSIGEAARPPLASPTAAFQPPPAMATSAPLPGKNPAPAVGAIDPSFLLKQRLDCAMQLARSVALDFNNALTGILGHASLLLSRADAPPSFRESLVEIEKSAAKAAEIAADLAAFTRQEKDNRQQTAGNLNTLLERAVESFCAEHPKIAWALQLERRLCTSNFDEAKMQQAFAKIIENAIQACNPDGRINLQTRNLELTGPTQDLNAHLNPGNYVCVEISDNGSGIAPDILPRVFEPFFTTKGRNHRGLGLAWVYGIVTNHGGAVAISSAVGTGCSVRVYLPANKKLVRNAKYSGDDLRGTETILFVDDEDLMITMGQMVLAAYGYTVLTASSGAKALETLAKSPKPVHLMITDLVMPGMGGAELTQQIQKLSPRTRVIWTSGAIRASKDQDADSYLQKPFTAQDLLRKIKETLSQ